MSTKKTNSQASPKALDEIVVQLDRCMRDMCAAQTSLLEIIAEKHEAMRRSDVQRMLAASAAEGVQANTILAIEKKRLDATMRLAVLLRLEPAMIPPTMKVLAARLPEKSAKQLLGIAAELRERMLKVAEANRVVELVCQKMLAHFKEMFSAIVDGGEAPPTYSANGERSKQTAAKVLDAIG